MPSSRYAPPKDLSAYAWLSIGAALTTIALKGWAAWMTGSVGLLSDAAESAVNLVAAVIALIVLKISIRPADEDHQFGHSKAEYFSAIVEGTMIFVAAAFIIFSAIERLITPVLDAVVALGAGLNIMWTGFTLIRDSVAGFMDIAPSAEALAAITEVLDRHRRAGVIDFHAVRVREAGNRRFADVHMLVPGTWSVKQGHDFTERMIDELVEADPSLRVSAHLEPIEDPKSYDDVDDV